MKLQPIVNLLPDKGKLMDFLLQRKECKMVILSVCSQSKWMNLLHRSDPSIRPAAQHLSVGVGPPFHALSVARSSILHLKDGLFKLLERLLNIKMTCRDFGRKDKIGWFQVKANLNLGTHEGLGLPSLVLKQIFPLLIYFENILQISAIAIFFFSSDEKGLMSEL